MVIGEIKKYQYLLVDKSDLSGVMKENIGIAPDQRVYPHNFSFCIYPIYFDTFLNSLPYLYLNLNNSILDTY